MFMRYFAMLFAAMLFFFAVAVFIYLRAKQAFSQTNRDRKVRREKLLDDSTDERFWELGQNRPIIDTATGHAGFGRRTFFRRLARGAVVSVVGWIATRGFGMLRAETPATQTEHPVEPAQNNHGDNHHDNHDDAGHSDNSTHIDDHGDQGYRSTHSDSHIDRNLHSDYHSDNGHTDYHGDNGN
jgi:hypothetical protein